MEEWQKDFFEMLETASREVEKFFEEVGEEVAEMVDGFVELSEELAEEVQNNIFNGFEQFFNQLVEPVIEIHIELEQEEISQQDMFWQYSEPTAEKNPACRGCQHYHGQYYGGNLLVCGMHPYGWDGENCPDWEGY